MTTKTVRVNVTAEDIAAGLPEAPDRCPVALAMNRDFPYPSGWRITTGFWKGRRVGIATAIGWEALSIRLSEAVGRFVLDFDREWDDAVQPFTFRVWR